MTADTELRVLVRTMPRRGRPQTHYGNSTEHRGSVRLACTGRRAHGYVIDLDTEAGALHAEKGVTCKSCSGDRREPIRDAAPLLHPSLLSARDRKTMHPEAQIQKLVRIGRRAIAHADWVEECMTTAPHLYRPGSDQYAHSSADVTASRAKAKAASEEMLRIARTHGIRPEITRRFK